MPLYMDLHIISDITIDEVKRAHMADLEVQDKYDVKYHQFWVNEEAGTLFCLIEGPDKESCAQVHREAHGNVACQIVEVESGFYNLVMGDAFQTDHGLVRHNDGKIDTGYRFVAVIDIIGHTRAVGPSDFRKLLLPEQPKKLIRRIIPSYRGREIRRSTEYSIIAIFTEATDALSCAVEIQTEFLKKSNPPKDDTWDINFRIGVGGGQPVTEEDDFFEKTIRLSQRLSLIAEENEIVVSPFVEKFSGVKPFSEENQRIKSIQTPEETFLENLFDITEENLSDSTFNVKQLCRNLGISRPQLYRKITSATGHPPSHFIRNVKMKRALSLIRKREFNISEVALKVGYNNPSYFSKCFRETYGVTPSQFLDG